MSFVIAIDGPAAAGKGTIARALSAHLGAAHLDTGLLYRAVGALAREIGAPTADIALRAALNLSENDLARDDLRSAEAGEAASIVATYQPVRDALVAWQRRFAARPEGAVLDGRDIGTVICPNANLKFFITASAETRAKRRFEEFQAATPGITLAQVLEQIEARDARDASRETAPLAMAEGAHLLDTTNMSIERAVAEAVRIAENQLARG